jgi:hypothetical protein
MLGGPAFFHIAKTSAGVPKLMHIKYFQEEALAFFGKIRLSPDFNACTYK